MIWVRRFFMIVVPLMLVALEWNHPSGFSKNVFAGLHHQAIWWKYLHLFQGILFGGIILGAYFLTSDSDGLWSQLSKIFLFIFGVTYLIFDSTAGIAVGSILQTYQENPGLDERTVQVIVQKLFTDPVIGGTASLFSTTESLCWLLCIVTAMNAIYLTHRDLTRMVLLPPLILLGISGLSLFIGHFFPYGPIAFASFALASIWMDYFNFFKTETSN